MDMWDELKTTEAFREAVSARFAVLDARINQQGIRILELQTQLAGQTAINAELQQHCDELGSVQLRAFEAISLLTDRVGVLIDLTNVICRNLRGT